MNIVLFPLRILYFIYASLLFIALMLLVFPWVLVAMALGPVRGGNILNSVCRTWSDLWLVLVGIYCPVEKQSNTQIPEKCIYVANHISYMDIPMVFKAVRRPLRILGKAEMGKIPVFGLIYRLAAVTVDRSDPAKRAASIRRLSAALRRGISIFLFPEGTFNETGKPLKSFYDGAFRLAIEMQQPIQPVIFPDTLARMHYRSILSLQPGRCRIIYLEPVSTAGLTHKDLAGLRQHVYDKMEDALMLHAVMS